MTTDDVDFLWLCLAVLMAIVFGLIGVFGHK